MTVPVRLFTEEGTVSEKKFKFRIDPSKIISYGPGYYKDDPEPDKTSIDLQGGNSILAFLPVLEFEDLLNDFTNRNGIQ